MITLSCLGHVKRAIGSNGRPDPPAFAIDATIVGDRSYSMRSQGEAPKTGVREFLQKHKSLVTTSSAGAHVQCTTFDDKVETPFDGNIKTISKHQLAACVSAMTPRGSTKMYDTAIAAIKAQQDRVQERIAALTASQKRLMKKLGSKFVVTFTLITDGLDNQSIADEAAFKRAIQRHRNSGAVCIFAAANQDAALAGKRAGFDPNTVLQMGADPDTSVEAFRACTASAIRATSGQVPTMTQLERQRSYAGPYNSAPARPSLGGGRGLTAPAHAPSIPNHNSNMGGGGAPLLAPPRPPRRYRRF